MDFLTNGKDTDLLILEKLNDRDLINICLANKSANKLCNNDDFWRNRFLQKWGYFDKSENRSWKNLYLTILKYLPEKGQIPFSGIASSAAYRGDIDMVKFAVAKGAENIEDIAFNATLKNNFDIVKYAIEKGVKTGDFIMSSAAYEGNIDIVKFMIEKGATNFNRAMDQAAYKGHLNIVKLMVKEGATDFDKAIKSAREGGKEELDSFDRWNVSNENTLRTMRRAKIKHVAVIDYLKSIKRRK
jgi:hypothetical protein